jgi:hypothetical protein
VTGKEQIQYPDLDDVDRQDSLKTLAEVCQKTGFRVQAYSRMRIHFRGSSMFPVESHTRGDREIRSTKSEFRNNLKIQRTETPYWAHLACGDCPKARLTDSHFGHWGFGLRICFGFRVSDFGFDHDSWPESHLAEPPESSKNHFRLVVETPNANLVTGRRWLLQCVTSLHRLLPPRDGQRFPSGRLWLTRILR